MPGNRLSFRQIELNIPFKPGKKSPVAHDGERELFLVFPGERTNFTFSPDRKSLAIARSKPTQDIVALTDER